MHIYIPLNVDALIHQDPTKTSPGPNAYQRKDKAFNACIQGAWHQFVAFADEIQTKNLSK